MSTKTKHVISHLFIIVLVIFSPFIMLIKDVYCVSLSVNVLFS